jgi:hypothetical protein
MAEYLVETLIEAQPVVSESTDDGVDLLVLVGNTYSESSVSDVSIVEVYSVPPEVDTKIEAFLFSHSGNLSVVSGTSQLPIAGGQFSFQSIAARVATTPSGSSIVLDIKKNGSSIFPLPADRPTIVAGSSDATVGSWGNATVTTGDYLSVDIVAVGSSTPGANLVVTLRLRKIG